MRKITDRLFIAILLFTLAFHASAKIVTISVTTNGPSLFATVAQARRGRAQKVRILLRGGTYALTEPLVLTAKDSGLIIEGDAHEKTVLSGRAVIRGWTCSPNNPNVWQTEIPAVRNGNWIFHELFVNGKRKSRTRIPEQGYFRTVGPGVTGRPTELEFHPGDIKPEWAQSGDVELVAFSAWAQTRNQIRNVFTASNIVSLAGKALANGSEKNPRFYIENAPVELRPGQWHLDISSGLLTYWPEAGEDVPNATITAPRLYDLVQIKGSADQPASNITFRGITFADADWRLDGGSDIDDQAAVEVPAAVQCQFARDCAFEQCTFQRLGGYALELDRGCQRVKIVGNEMSDLGAGGIRVGESDMNEAITHPCDDNIISDNHIHDIGLVNAPAVGIFILLSAQNCIAHNEVDHTYYTTISVGWSWGYAENPCRGNIVEYNNLHDIGQGMLSDMGGVYTLGVQPGAIVRNNLIHDVNIFGYGGWGLYTDEGSSGILLENNIIYNCQSAGFHQHYGRDNVIRNNIFAFNKEGQLARTRIERNRAFVFTNNIVYFDSGALFSGNWGDDLIMDDNLYFDLRSLSGNHQTQATIGAWQKRGHDLHSLFADPLFVDARHHNFHLKAKSPALSMGFHPIDLSKIGPRKQYRRP